MYMGTAAHPAHEHTWFPAPRAACARTRRVPVCLSLVWTPFRHVCACAYSIPSFLNLKAGCIRAEDLSAPSPPWHGMASLWAAGHAPMQAMAAAAPHCFFALTADQDVLHTGRCVFERLRPQCTACCMPFSLGGSIVWAPLADTSVLLKYNPFMLATPAPGPCMLRNAMASAV